MALADNILTFIRHDLAYNLKNLKNPPWPPFGMVFGRTTS